TTAIVSVLYGSLQFRAAEKSRQEEARTKAALNESQRKSADFAVDRGLQFCEDGEIARGLLWLARSLSIAPNDANDLRHAARSNISNWANQLGSRLSATLRLPSPITAVAISPDGKSVLTGAADGCCQLWDATTSNPIGPAFRQVDGIRSAAFSPDGTLIL